MNFLKESLFGLLVGLQQIGLYLTITNKLFTVDRCEGESMMPTLPQYSIVFVDKLLQKIFGLKKGQIITAKSPIKTNEYICKRVVSIAGEILQGFKIPRNHIWIEGDNKENSYDSRYYGPIPACLVTGKVVCVIYPFKLLG